MGSLNLGWLDPVKVMDILWASTEQGVSLLDPADRIIQVNPALCRMLGYSAEELFQRSFYEVVLHKRSAAAAGEAPTVNAYEALFWRRDGTSFSGRFIRHSFQEEGQVPGTLVLVKETELATVGLPPVAQREQQVMAYMQMLSAAIERIHSSLDFSERLHRIAGAAIPYLGNRVSVDLWEPATQELSRSAVVTAESLRTGVPAGGECAFSFDALQGAPLGKVIRSRKPLVLNNITPEIIACESPDPNLREHTLQLNPKAMMMVPMESDDGLLGVVTFSYTDCEGSYSALDLALAQDLARHAGLAISNIRLYLRAQQHMRVIEESTDIIWLIDSQWRITFFNERAAQHLGWSQAMIGQSLLAHIPQRYLPEVRVSLDRLKSGKAVEDWPGAFARNGREFVFSFSAVPMTTGDKVSGACIFGRDITDLKRVQKRLENGLERLERLSELDRDLLECDTRWELMSVAVNHLRNHQSFHAACCFLWNATAGRLELCMQAGAIRFPRLSIPPPAWWNTPGWTHVRVSKHEHEDPLLLQHSAGTAGVEMSVPVWHAGKMVAVLVVMAADREGFTGEQRALFRATADQLSRFWERSYLYEELRSKTDEIESFLFATSHDLRSPLVNTIGFTQEIENAIRQIRSTLADAEVPRALQAQIDTIWEEDVEPSARFVGASVRKMEGLVEGILQLSRVGRIPLNMEYIADPTALMHASVAAMQIEIEQSGARVEIEPLPSVYADRTRLGQIFSNLIGNAVKYLDTTRPGVIRVWGTQVDGKVRYCVSDNGIGIHPDHAAQIFRPFHRLKSNDTQGHGLGLSIAERAVRRHQGRVWVESVPGKGSDFWVELPKGDE